MIDTILSIVTQGAYYIGVLAGVLISTLVFFSMFNKALTRLTMGDEINTRGTLNSPYSLTKNQINQLKVILLRWNKQCDSWYTTEANKIDKVLTGRKVNLIDVQRIASSTNSDIAGTFGKDITRKDQKAFDKLGSQLEELNLKLIKEMEQKKVIKKIHDEMDVAGKQLKIAKCSAIAAISSAVATIALTVLAYINN